MDGKRAGKKKAKAAHAPKLWLERALGCTSPVGAGGLAWSSGGSGVGSGEVAWLAGAVVVCYNPSDNRQTRFFSYHNASTTAPALPGAPAAAAGGGYASGLGYDPTRKAKRLTCVAFSPNGKYIAAGESGREPAVFVWDFATGKLLAELTGHSVGVRCIRFAPNSEHLVSSGDAPNTGAVPATPAAGAAAPVQRHHSIMLWHWPSSSDPVCQSSTPMPVNALDFAENGTYFVSGSKLDVSFWYLSPPNACTTPTVVMTAAPATNSSSGASDAEDATPRPTFGVTGSGSERVTMERHGAKLLEGHDKRNFVAVCCGRSPPPVTGAVVGTTAATAAPALGVATASDNCAHLVYALTDNGILAMLEQKIDAPAAGAAAAGATSTPAKSSPSAGGAVGLWRIVKWLDAKLDASTAMTCSPGFVTLAGRNGMLRLFSTKALLHIQSIKAVAPIGPPPAAPGALVPVTPKLASAATPAPAGGSSAALAAAAASKPPPPPPQLFADVLCVAVSGPVGPTGAQLQVCATYSDGSVVVYGVAAASPKDPAKVLRHLCHHSPSAPVYDLAVAPSPALPPLSHWHTLGDTASDADEAAATAAANVVVTCGGDSTIRFWNLNDPLPAAQQQLLVQPWQQRCVYVGHDFSLLKHDNARDGIFSQSVADTVRDAAARQQLQEDADDDDANAGASDAKRVVDSAALDDPNAVGVRAVQLMLRPLLHPKPRAASDERKLGASSTAAATSTAASLAPGWVLGAGDRQGMIRLYDVTRSVPAALTATVGHNGVRPLCVLAGHTKEVLALDFSHPFPVPTTAATAAAASSASSASSAAASAAASAVPLLASGGRDRSVVIYDLSDAMNPGASKGPAASAAAPAASALASSSSSTVSIKPIPLGSVHSSSVTAVRFGDNGHSLISCGADQAIVVRALSASRPQVPGASSVAAAAAAGAPASVEVSATQRGAVPHGGLHDCAVHPTNKAVMTCGADRTLRVWTMAAKLQRHYKADTSVGAAPTPTSGGGGDVSARGAAALSGVGGGEPLRVSLDPGGLFAAVGGTDKSIRLIDWYSGQCVARVMAHSDAISGVRFSPDCKRLISVGRDGCVMVWRLADVLTAQIHKRLDELYPSPHDTPATGAAAAAALPAPHLDTRSAPPPTTSSSAASTPIKHSSATTNKPKSADSAPSTPAPVVAAAQWPGAPAADQRKPSPEKPASSPVRAPGSGAGVVVPTLALGGIAAAAAATDADSGRKKGSDASPSQSPKPKPGASGTNSAPGSGRGNASTPGGSGSGDTHLAPPPPTSSRWHQRAMEHGVQVAVRASVTANFDATLDAAGGGAAGAGAGSTLESSALNISAISGTSSEAGATRALPVSPSGAKLLGTPAKASPGSGARPTMGGAKSSASPRGGAGGAVVDPAGSGKTAKSLEDSDSVRLADEFEPDFDPPPPDSPVKPDAAKPAVPGASASPALAAATPGALPPPIRSASTGSNSGVSGLAPASQEFDIRESIDVATDAKANAIRHELKGMGILKSKDFAGPAPTATPAKPTDAGNALSRPPTSGPFAAVSPSRPSSAAAGATATATASSVSLNPHDHHSALAELRKSMAHTMRLLTAAKQQRLQIAHVQQQSMILSASASASASVSATGSASALLGAGGGLDSIAQLYDESLSAIQHEFEQTLPTLNVATSAHRLTTAGAAASSGHHLMPPNPVLSASASNGGSSSGGGVELGRSLEAYSDKLVELVARKLSKQLKNTLAASGVVNAVAAGVITPTAASAAASAATIAERDSDAD